MRAPNTKTQHSDDDMAANKMILSPSKSERAVGEWSDGYADANAVGSIKYRTDADTDRSGYIDPHALYIREAMFPNAHRTRADMTGASILGRQWRDRTESH